MKATVCANYVIYVLSGVCDDLTNMKLNKILFFTQGHSLAQRGRPVFDDEIQAWDYGPVIPSVYERYRKYADSPIREWNPDELKGIDPDDREFMFNAAREYCGRTASELSRMTHRKGGVWDRSRKKGRNALMTGDEIRGDFMASPKKIGPVELSFSDDDFIGYTDPDGHLVLPKEWHD